jgi:hypothetical protein
MFDRKSLVVVRFVCENRVNQLLYVSIRSNFGIDVGLGVQSDLDHGPQEARDCQVARHVRGVPPEAVRVSISLLFLEKCAFVAILGDFIIIIVLLVSPSTLFL